MRIVPACLADAFVELALSVPEDQIPALARAVVEKLDSKSFRSFPRLVRRTFDRRARQLTMDIATPMADTTLAEAVLVSQIEKKRGAKIDVRRSVDPALIGGVRVRLGDDKFDYSIQGALEKLHVHLAYAHTR